MKNKETPANGKDAKRTRKKILALALAALLIVAAFLGGWFGRYASLDPRTRSLLWAIDTAKNNYYTEVDEDALYDRLFSALELDPYSRYYTKEEYSAVYAQNGGSYSGWGFSVISSEESDSAFIFRVLENSPAQFAGLKKGMYVLAFGREEEELTAGDRNAFLDFMQEGPDTVYLRCGYRADGADAQTICIAARAYRAAYCSYRDSETSFGFRSETGAPVLTETENPLSSLDGKTAYIRIEEFHGNAVNEFAALLTKMKERGRENLILDLRSNGGGYLDVFLGIASLLVKEGKSGCVLAQAVFGNGTKKSYTGSASRYSEFFGENSRVVVLGDENTASASECPIGALVDYGTVGVGDIFLRKNEEGIFRTYGKGIMQSTFTDSAGNVLKLTVAEIVWPKGRSIHGKGVTEEEGAVGIEAPLVWGESDPLLDAAISSFAD
ncbi:MAG: S41 family peptidase [Candidatus Gallimonas sp.]